MKDYFKFKHFVFEIQFEDEAVVLIDKVDAIKKEAVETVFSKKVKQELLEYFEGKRKSFSFKYELQGTEFQKKVWHELLNIPYGKTKSYKEIAIAIERPNAQRAVGMALKKNPIPIVVPCHRVIAANQGIGGFSFGLELKSLLLNLEDSHSKPHFELSK